MTEPATEAAPISQVTDPSNLQVGPNNPPVVETKTPSGPSLDYSWASDPGINILDRHRLMRDDMEFEMYRAKVAKEQALMTQDVARGQLEIEKTKREEQEDLQARDIMARLTKEGKTSRSDWIKAIHESGSNKVLIQHFKDMDAGRMWPDAAERDDRKERRDDDILRAEMEAWSPEERTAYENSKKTLATNRNLLESTIAETARQYAQATTAESAKAEIELKKLEQYKAQEEMKVMQQKDYIAKKMEGDMAEFKTRVAQGEMAEDAQKTLDEKKLVTAFTMVKMFRRSGVKTDGVTDQELAQHLNTVGFTPEDIPALRYGLSNLGSNADDQQTYREATELLQGDPESQKVGRAQLASLVESWRVDQMAAAQDMDNNLADLRKANLSRKTKAAEIEATQAKDRVSRVEKILISQDSEGKVTQTNYTDLMDSDKMILTDMLKARGVQPKKVGGETMFTLNGKDVLPDEAIASLVRQLQKESEEAGKRHSEIAGQEIYPGVDPAAGAAGGGVGAPRKPPVANPLDRR